MICFPCVSLPVYCTCILWFWRLCLASIVFCVVLVVIVIFEVTFKFSARSIVRNVDEVNINETSAPCLAMVTVWEIQENAIGDVEIDGVAKVLRIRHGAIDEEEEEFTWRKWKGKEFLVLVFPSLIPSRNYHGCLHLLFGFVSFFLALKCFIFTTRYLFFHFFCAKTPCARIPLWIIWRVKFSRKKICW
jgi:hypothetical protein